MNRWLNNKRWSSGRGSGCRWDRVYGVDWANFTVDNFQRPDNSQPDSRYWEIRRNDLGYASIQNNKLRYVAPSEPADSRTRYRLKAYLSIEDDFDVRVWFSNFSSQRPPIINDRNYAASIFLFSYPDYVYRALCARHYDAAYNGYVCDSDVTSQSRFNYSPETSGAVRMHKTGGRLYASRWRLNQWLWNNDGPPYIFPIGVEAYDFYIEIGFSSDSNASISVNNDRFEVIDGTLIGVE